ncbi:MAG: dUTP diphosphatase [SAR324 cluster bacterium]|nr:dUTP diphosphatase [SAR324 cluster bacterium]
MKKVETKILNPKLGTEIPLPAYATDGAAGMDIRACIDHEVTILPSETRIIPSGFAIHINDPSLVAMIVPRSGLGIKHGIVLGNLCAVIDSDYMGEISIGLWNRGAEPYTIQPGERVCQMLFVPVLQVSLELVNDFSSDSERGQGGLGSTGSH